MEPKQMTSIPVENIAANANRWVVLTTVRLVHPSYCDAVGDVTGGAARASHDSLDAAIAEARDLLSDAARPVAPGSTRQTELVSVCIRGYRDSTVRFRPAPLSSPEWQDAWDNGPGAEA